MQGCSPEWRTKFEREATTRDSKRGHSGSTVIRVPSILCTPLSKFLDPPLQLTYLFLVYSRDRIHRNFSTSVMKTATMYLEKLVKSETFRPTNKKSTHKAGDGSFCYISPPRLLRFSCIYIVSSFIVHRDETE